MAATTTDLAGWLRQGMALAFDTNAMFSNRFLDVCDALNGINSRRPDGPQIRKLVVAPVHMEKLHDLRQRLGDRYDPHVIEDGLREKGIDIVPFTLDHAEHAAERLGALYPTTADWRAFKRRRCIHCLGLSKHAAAHAPGDGKACGATIDWLIAAHADAEGMVLVTDDKGPEFDGLQYIARLPDVADAAAQILDELATTA